MNKTQYMSHAEFDLCSAMGEYPVSVARPRCVSFKASVSEYMWFVTSQHVS